MTTRLHRTTALLQDYIVAIVIALYGDAIRLRKRGRIEIGGALTGERRGAEVSRETGIYLQFN